MTLKCNKRIRDIDAKEYSKSGKLISVKRKKKVIEFESGLEQDLIYLLEFDESVEQYVEQPITIPYSDKNGKERIYIPDFFVSFIDKSKKNQLIEVKYSIELKNNNLELKYKFDAAKSFCLKNNLEFKILSEIEIRQHEVFLNNIKLLSNYKNSLDCYQVHRKLNLNTNHMHGILNFISLKGQIKMIDAIELYSKNDEIRYEVFYWIFHLLSLKYLKTDLFIPLSKNSIIWQ